MDCRFDRLLVIAVRNGVRLTLELAEQQSLKSLTSHRFSPAPEMDPAVDEQVITVLEESRIALVTTVVQKI